MSVLVLVFDRYLGEFDANFNCIGRINAVLLILILNFFSSIDSIPLISGSTPTVTPY